MSQILSFAFVGFLLLMVGLKYWLAWRQVRHVARNALSVPRQFADRIPLEAHRKAASYTIAKTRLALLETAAGAAVLVVLTLLGGLEWIAESLRAWVGDGFGFQVLVVITVVVLLGIIDLPFSWIRQFRIEAHYGFNRMTPALWLTALAKSFVLAALLGVPLLAAVIGLMRSAGSLWWVYPWLLWVGFNRPDQGSSRSDLSHPSALVPLLLVYCFLRKLHFGGTELDDIEILQFNGLRHSLAIHLGF